MAHVLRVFLTSIFGPTFTAISHRLYPREKEGWMDITEIHLTLPRLDPQFQGYRLVHISDLHIGTWLDERHLTEAVEQINQLNPDLVAITGDFVTFEPEKYAPVLTDKLSKLRPNDGTFAVLGNHDHWTDPDVIRDVLTESNIIDLSNTVHTIRRNGSSLHVSGVDDIMNNLDRLDKVLANLPVKGAAILLAHEPDFADTSAAAKRFDLQLSGHSHGGQIVFPRIGPLVLPSYSKKYPQGLYEIENMLLYTNRGLGTAELPIRYNCPAEISVIVLHPRQPRDDVGSPARH